MLSSFCWSKSEPIFLPYSSPPETMAKHPPSVTGIAYSSEVSEHQALLFRVSNQISITWFSAYCQIKLTPWFPSTSASSSLQLVNLRSQTLT